MICFMVISVTPAQYFRAKRGLANGLVFAGVGFRGAAISATHRMGLPHSRVDYLATGLPAAWLIKERNRATSNPGFIEWHLFEFFMFVFFLASAIGTFPLFVPRFFLPLYTKSLGFSSSVGAGLVAGFSLASAAGRIACSLFCDRR
ncbi:hypothetical protein jhhlp_008093 [Lomentospora prolificans]|uniref:Major facilitator superfamily (MFS) profile domain-containing protein n=1 Tax=Lomentospora prolificans TaxID=41688 RepID=A0A2N3MZI9_9PEZI|nr:hypothetical protein jhhlp_008093 [Lomentospora prolificans]